MALNATICGANGWADVERFVKAKIEWLKDSFLWNTESPVTTPSDESLRGWTPRSFSQPSITGLMSSADAFEVRVSSSGRLTGSTMFRSEAILPSLSTTTVQRAMVTGRSEEDKRKTKGVRSL